MALAYKVSDFIVSASTEPEAFGELLLKHNHGKTNYSKNIGGSRNNN
ncbi:MAG: hypothetical protein CM1200mP13_04530 [Candidatus Pelagibacterales bacterium]|nr:MAG: hypothetical protein CM1200mP13_04530 [Pelagibacterales bacterium]